MPHPLRCPQCKEGWMEGRVFSWKRVLGPMLMFTIVLFPLGYYLRHKPDWYECPKCGRKKVNFA
jgi:rubrerythrin